MRQRISRLLRVTCLLLTAGLLTACGEAESRDLHLLTGATPPELARTHLAAAVLKQQGFNVTIEEARLGQIWQRLWAGKADASVTVWLPQASAPFVERFFDRLDDVGAKDAGLASEADLWPDRDKPHTVVRRSLAQASPQAVLLLRNLQWQPQDLEQIMALWQQSQDWSLAADRWLAEHSAGLPTAP